MKNFENLIKGLRPMIVSGQRFNPMLYALSVAERMGEINELPVWQYQNLLHWIRDDIKSKENTTFYPVVLLSLMVGFGFPGATGLFIECYQEMVDNGLDEDTEACVRQLLMNTTAIRMSVLSEKPKGEKK